MTLHPNHTGPLFCHLGYSPITRYHFPPVLNKAISVLNLDTIAYNSHLFRIWASKSAIKGFLSNIIQTWEDRSQIVTKHKYVFLNFNSIKKKLISDSIHQIVWLFGSSIIKKAFVDAFIRPCGSNLNLERLNITLWWQDYGWMELIYAILKLELMKQVDPSLNVILSIVIVVIWAELQ